MKIEVLYFEDCPNYIPTRDLVHDVVNTLKIDATIEQIAVEGPDHAQDLRFLGSPSIRVNGRDIEPGANERVNFGYSCRTYETGGTPPRAMLEAALRGEDYIGAQATAPSNECCCETPKADDPPTNPRRGMLSMGGSVAAAVVASACCWLPVTLAGVGLSAGGVASLFETTRPFFLGAAALFLGFGFYSAYRRQPACEKGSTCATDDAGQKRRGRVYLWMATAAVIAAAFYPNYAGYFAADAPNVAIAATHELSVEIGGMSCEGCALSTAKALGNMPGVLHASVDFDTSLAKVLMDASATLEPSEVETLLKELGYSGRIMN